ncbi:putative uncharacterized protein CXorf58 homolog isoform X3 [Sarcophilus harrisii]|uniref:putative uncharacterized protein CXorf58 homolog isoform X3 n=1 Tax=Sarcophilus harrisii TaxID=9305 RepID=UPI0013019CCE|nr:putative uncharacterized protein CXorf58 homolog isoform X3 [Sarcophilus harrisii]
MSSVSSSDLDGDSDDPELAAKLGAELGTEFQEVNLSDVVPLDDLKAIEKGHAAQVIQRAWCSHMDKMMFQLLKHTICAAAVVDACKLMGNRKYYDQIIQDQLQFQKYKVADEVDVVTMKDYMHFTSFLDETPAYLGGKSNCWRRLSLQNFPKTMIMYDIMDYATSGTLSDRLQKELKYLLQKPKSEEMQRDQLRIISQIRTSPSSSSISVSSLQQYYQQLVKPKHSGRRSKQARMKIAKMRRTFKKEKEKKMEEPNMQKRNEKNQHQIVIITPSYEILGINSPPSDDELEQEAKELFTWTRDLCLDNS